MAPIVAVLLSSTELAHGASPLCLAGCVKADVKGLKDISDALKDWSRLLPGLNEKFHEGVQDDLRLMDQIAGNLVRNIDQLYGKNVDLTNQRIRSLIDKSIVEINIIGRKAEFAYRRALFEAECTVESLASIVGDRIENSIPDFQWFWSFFGYRHNVLKINDFQRNEIELEFDPTSRTDEFRASFELLTLKLNSASEGTELEDLLTVALDRQRLAYSYFCASRGSVGSIDGIGHIYDRLQNARADYLNLNLISKFGARL